MRSGTRGRRPRRGEGRPEQTATVRIETIAAGGDGVGRIDGLACFVPRTAPGDLVQVAFTSQARFARGRVLQLLEPSPDRVAARCRHFERDQCGGCQLQHLSDEAQRAVRSQVVQDALQRVGHRTVERPTVTQASAWGYRGRLTLTAQRQGGRVTAGLHRGDRPGTLFAPDECPIADARLVKAWQAVRAHGMEIPTAVADAPIRMSFRLVDAPVDAAMDDAITVGLVVQGGYAFGRGVAWAESLLAAVPAVSAVWWVPEGGDGRCLAGREDRSVLSFTQVNAGAAALLRAHVLELVRAQHPASMVDAYAGRGELSRVLAADGVRVAAVELDAAATAVAAAALEGVPHARVLTGLVEAMLPAVLPADVVVLNPPRRGVDPQVTTALADSADQGVRAIVYVSCDPATLARDLTRLPRWRIAALHCFDLFPQTAHVETVCLLLPESA